MSKTNEEWREVRGYEGLYEVSDWGRVRSLDKVVCYSNGKGDHFHKGKILSHKVHKDGHLQVGLSCGSKVKWCFVHRLVAQAFIPNPNNFPVINHKDENPTNNCVENLEWCTIQYNSQYSVHKISRPIICNGIEYPSIRALARELNTDSKGIRYRLENGGLFKRKYEIHYKEREAC